MAAEKPKRESQLQVQLDDEVAQGVYANLTMVNHTESEFTLDFIYLQPQQPRAKVRTRIISSAKHTKRLLMALKENIEKYEKKFGEIDISGPSPADEALH